MTTTNEEFSRCDAARRLPASQGERPSSGLVSSHRASRVARRWFVSLWALLAMTQSGAADTDDPAVAALCDLAAEQVSRESGVPRSVLRAITLTETGRTRNGSFRPWPWTVNMEGKGIWFPTRRDAQAYVDLNFERGARSFDVGCFQINYRWHGDAFASLEEMFDPLVNTRYAARFLGELFGEFGDWSKAAGAYHSRTPLHANRYRARFDRIRARHGGGEGAAETFAAKAPARGNEPRPVAVPAPATARPNLFPLLKARSGARSIGSLVPLGAEPAAGLRFIGEPGAARQTR